jgi:preprotein translocase subunit SecE
MDRIRSYVMASYDELMHKVSWPTWEELQSSAIVVLIGTTIIAALVWVMDISSKLLLQELLYKKLFG